MPESGQEKLLLNGSIHHNTENLDVLPNTSTDITDKDIPPSGKDERIRELESELVRMREVNSYLLKNSYRDRLALGDAYRTIEQLRQKCRVLGQQNHQLKATAQTLYDHLTAWRQVFHFNHFDGRITVGKIYAHLLAKSVATISDRTIRDIGLDEPL